MDEVQADRWAAEIDKYGLRAVGFVTGGGNDNLAKVIQHHPDKFIALPITTRSQRMPPTNCAAP